jgi:hypothetical protein
MSAAAELRKAAETLRALATAATHEPWTHYPDMWVDGTPVHRIGSNAAGSDVGITPREDVHNGLADAAYIATMHPGVGLALADWLDRAAEKRARGEELLGTDRFRTSEDSEPIALARLINGGAA